MLCSDIHINVQDASGDRILAGDMLTKDATNWKQWVERVNTLERQGKDLAKEQEEDTHVGHVLGHGREKRRFKKTPRLGRGMPGTSCRVYGSLEGNKVQGDFHITARGHGYMEFGQHLDHSGTSSLMALSLSALSFSKQPSQLPLLEKYCIWRHIDNEFSLQLLPHHQRTILRAPLPLPPQSSGQNIRHNQRQLLQIPILPLGRPYNLHPNSLSQNPLHQLPFEHALHVLRHDNHKPIRRNLSVP